MFPFLLLAAAVQPADSLLPAFEDICTLDQSAQRILSRADKRGWKSAGPGMPAGFDSGSQRFRTTAGGTLTLVVNETTHAGETHQACGVLANFSDPEIVTQARGALGFAPAFAFGSGGTWFADLEGGRWHAVANQQQGLSAIARGHYYSILVGSDSAAKSSSIYDLRVMTPEQG